MSQSLAPFLSEPVCRGKGPPVRGCLCSFCRRTYGLIVPEIEVENTGICYECGVDVKLFPHMRRCSKAEQ